MLIKTVQALFKKAEKPIPYELSNPLFPPIWIFCLHNLSDEGMACLQEAFEENVVS